LQEDIYHKEHEEKGKYQGEDHFMNGREKELGHILLDGVFHAGRHRLLCLIQRFFYVGGNLCGVRSGDLLYHSHHGGLAVVRHVDVIHETSQLHLGHILQV